VVLFRRFRDLTNNLKLFRHDVVQQFQLVEPGFAVNAETGLQPLLMGYQIKEVPISWINRAPDMGMSSFKLARVGCGYWRVLARLWLRCLFGVGAYRTLPLSKKRMGTCRTNDAQRIRPIPEPRKLG